MLFEWDENKISIHALRVEGDEIALEQGKTIKISIHALRVEGDRRMYYGAQGN